jgi:hypothetical protein
MLQGSVGLEAGVSMTIFAVGRGRRRKWRSRVSPGKVGFTPMASSFGESVVEQGGLAPHWEF